MTRLRPDRGRLARFLGAALFLVPLLLATAAVPDAQPPPPPPPERLVLNDVIEGLSVRSEDERPKRVEIRMKAGTSRQTAEAVADHFADGGTPGDLVVVAATGERITRSRLNLDALPPPPPRHLLLRRLPLLLLLLPLQLRRHLLPLRRRLPAGRRQRLIASRGVICPSPVHERPV